MKLTATRETILAPLQSSHRCGRAQADDAGARERAAGRRGTSSSAITGTDLEVELVATSDGRTCSSRAKSPCPAASCSTSVRAFPEKTQRNGHRLEGERVSIRRREEPLHAVDVAGS